MPRVPQDPDRMGVEVKKKKPSPGLPRADLEEPQ